MNPSIFYSWQSDAPERICKYFIRDAINKALKKLNCDASLIEAPRLDQDTKNVAGTPDVAATIYSKISSCAVFISDLTLVAEVKNNGKKMPNANVVLECGFAAAEIGWPRLVSVMNISEGYGTAKELIFDLIHKRHPIEYSLGEDSLDRKSIQDSLVEGLRLRIKTCLSEAHVQAERLLSRLEFQSLSFLSLFGCDDYFNLGSHERFLQNQLVRLLDLDLLRFDYSAERGQYAYHWTYLGRIVLVRLRIRKEESSS